MMQWIWADAAAMIGMACFSTRSTATAYMPAHGRRRFPPSSARKHNIDGYAYHQQSPLALVLSPADNNRAKLFGTLWMANTSEDAEAKEIESKGNQNGYNPPAFSESFLQHLESVESSWPYDPNANDDGSETTGGNDKANKSGSGEGVYCTGEPAMDPSRIVQSVLDGESDWI